MRPEQYWKENDEYHDRQGEVGSVEANIALFDSILTDLDGIETIIEFGAGEGRNIEAIHLLKGGIHTTAVEINSKAAANIPADNVLNINMFDYDQKEFGTADFVFTKGLLIHVSPSDIQAAYDCIYRSSSRYIMVAEYYNPVPQGVTYDGRTDLLWKRDFAGEMMDKYPDLKLIDYGFVYHRDEFAQDDLSWFLMEKIND